MLPAPVPAHAIEENPHLRMFSAGPPDGIPDEACGTVQGLEGHYKDTGVFDGAPQVTTYWKPSEEELAFLNNGGLVELTYLIPQMVVTQMNVVPNV